MSSYIFKSRSLLLMIRGRYSEVVSLKQGILHLFFFGDHENGGGSIERGIWHYYCFYIWVGNPTKY